MIETSCLKNVVIFIQTILSFVLSRIISKSFFLEYFYLQIILVCSQKDWNKTNAGSCGRGSKQRGFFSVSEHDSIRMHISAEEKF